MPHKLYSLRAFYLVLVLIVVLLLCASVLTPAPAHAQPPPWPTWIQIDSDPNEAGPSNDYRDVIRAYYNYDSNFLYLRLETYNTPLFPLVGARFKWLIDVGLGSNMYWQGQNILGSDYMVFVEDSDNNGSLEVYLLDAQGNDYYMQYEPAIYKTNPGPANPADAGYNLPGTGNYVDLYVRITALGVPDASHLSLVWATDQENPNLEQGPIVDSIDTGNTPIHLDADLRVTKDVDNHTPDELDTINYTVTITNTGPADATNIELTDQLPGGITYQSYSATQGTYNIVPDIWSVGDLINGGSATLTITAIVDAGTGGSTITNTAAITDVDQPDSHPGDNSDFANIFPEQAAPNEADLAVIKDVNNHLPLEGDTITYTVTVINTGPADATNIELTDQLPSEVTYQSYSASQGTYNNGSGIWSLGNLNDDGSAWLIITATVNSGTAGSAVFNTATITAVDQSDPHAADNFDIAEFIARAPTAVVATGVPVFPSMYVGLAAALGAGVIAYLLRRRVLGWKTSET
jgi:uncharacterized repeat protein (TIGR01451 family)